MNVELTKEFISIVKKYSPKCFINSQFELIVEPKNNIYFRLEDVESELDLKLKVLAWLSRPSCKGVSDYWQKRIRAIINEFLKTDFELRHMKSVYTRLGNGCNRSLAIEFIESDYDLRVLEKQCEKCHEFTVDGYKLCDCGEYSESY